MVMVGACGSTGLEVIVAASALGIKQHIFIPPLAEAWYGAAEIRIAKVTANAMLRPLPEVRGAIMVRSRNYDRIITRRAHQVFCKSSGNFAIFAAMAALASVTEIL